MQKQQFDKHWWTTVKFYKAWQIPLKFLQPVTEETAIPILRFLTPSIYSFTACIRKPWVPSCIFVHFKLYLNFIALFLLHIKNLSFIYAATCSSSSFNFCFFIVFHFMGVPQSHSIVDIHLDVFFSLSCTCLLSLSLSVTALLWAFLCVSPCSHVWVSQR